MNVNKILAFGMLCMASIDIAAQISFEGTQTVEIKPDVTTGLKAVYVVRDASNAFMKYSSSSSITWERFSSLGGGYAEPVSFTKEGNEYIIPLQGDMGYIINDGNNQTCVWVVNYANFPYSISELLPAESDCNRLMLNIMGQAPEMPYYTITGRRIVVDRQIMLTYNTLQFNKDSNQYVQIETSESIEYAMNTVGVTAPLCGTTVTIHPDRFASAWGLAQAVESQWVEPTAVAANVSAVQSERQSDNEQNMGDNGDQLGGSAPAEISFEAVVSDAAIFRRWEFSTSPAFDDTFLTFSDLVVDYTFEEAGTTYVRFVCDNAYGSCQFESEIFTITIGESRLECPNAFSPGTSEGVNDEWKVSYRSIIEFHCDIFNRWGQKLATLTDPSQGWDGMVGGKPVGSGVYFYVINALGSDGKKYKLSGDINVISSRRNTQTGGNIE